MRRGDQQEGRGRGRGGGVERKEWRETNLGRGPPRSGPEAGSIPAVQTHDERVLGNSF